MYKSGSRGDSESWTSWAFFNRDKGGKVHLKDSKIGYNPKDGTDMEDLCTEIGMDYFYSGPGRPFGHQPCVSVNKYHVLIYQTGGLDI